MENRELDAKCAEILGWRHISLAKGRLAETPKGKIELIPHYSTSLDAARELLEWVWVHDRSESVSEFELRLIGFRNQTDTVGFLLTTPRQIAESFVECFGGHDDPK